MTSPIPPSDSLRLPLERSGGPADPELAKERISTWLSAASMVMVVVGLTWTLWPRLGPFALVLGGCLLGVLVGVADALRDRDSKPEPEAAGVPPTAPAMPLPGPSDPGLRHTKGPGSKP